MKTFDMKLGGHDWEKQNLITLGVKKQYDVYKCKKCGITGRSYYFGMITIKESETNKINKCTDKGRKKKLYNKIKIIQCNAFGKQFERLTPGSIHDIISPPSGETNERGEWVMGNTEPVLLLAGEYEYITED